jgi:hypothetical protein
MVAVKANYRDEYWDTICPCCKLEEDNQEHMIEEEGMMIGSLPNYQNIFEKSI